MPCFIPHPYLPPPLLEHLALLGSIFSGFPDSCSCWSTFAIRQTGKHLLLWEISLDLSQSFPFLAPSAPPVSYGAKWYVLSPPPSLDCESTLIHVGPHGGLSAQEALSIFAK